MFLLNNEARLFAVDFGAGPRTILAHGGWTGSWELWVEPFIHLGKSWRTAAYDHRGTGASTAPVETITMKNMVDDLFAVMDHLQIDSCVLAAESAGGMVAVSAVLQQPQRFEGLVLVDALLHNKAGSSTVFIQGLQSHFKATLRQFVDTCVLQDEPNSREIRIWGMKILERTTPEAAVRLIEYSHGIDLRPQLERITVPTLVMHGDRDEIVPLYEAKYAASRIRTSHLCVIDGAGHVPTMTQPKRVAAEIDRFFLGQALS